MLYTTSAAALLAFAGHVYAQGSLAITTPAQLVVCQPAQLTVSGGTAPYFISILPGGQASAAPLESLPNVDAAGTFTWTVNLPAGSPITFQVRDNTGAVNYSQQVTPIAGTSTSCVGSSASVSSATAASTAASSAASSSSESAASSASSVASSASSVSRSAASAASSVAHPSTSTSSAPSASASHSGADKTITSGAVAAVAAVFAVLFA